MTSRHLFTVFSVHAFGDVSTQDIASSIAEADYEYTVQRDTIISWIFAVVVNIFVKSPFEPL